MTISFPTSAFEANAAVAHPLRAQRHTPSSDRIGGIVVVAAAHLVVAAMLLLGIQVTHAIRQEKPITIELPQLQKPQPPKPVAQPSMVQPSAVTAPPPMIDITPPLAPNAIAATPPKAETPAPMIAMPAPSPAPAGDGRVRYSAQLLAYLERFKQYPAAARAAHIEGAVMVRFVMRRDGHVLSREIAQSSGRPVLDREALAMIDRAGSLPPLPADMPGDTLDAVIGPIRFALH